jgi:TATA-binding protein-associated factor Taf7
LNDPITTTAATTNNKNTNNDTDNLENQKIKLLPQLVNDHLPPDIRLISVIRLTQSFRARQGCYWREYEYLLPLAPFLAFVPNHLKHLKPNYSNFSEIEKMNNTINNNTTSNCSNNNNNRSHDELLSRLDYALRKLEGSRSYHNFHRMKRRDMKKKVYSNNSKVHDDIKQSPGVDSAGVASAATIASESLKTKRSADVSEDNNADEEEGEDDDEGDANENNDNDNQDTNISTDNPSRIPMTNLYQRWYRMKRDISMKTKGTTTSGMRAMSRHRYMI